MYFLNTSNVYCQIVLLSAYVSIPFTVFLPVFDFMIILSQYLCKLIFSAKNANSSKDTGVSEKKFILENVMHEVIMIYKLANY